MIQMNALTHNNEVKIESKISEFHDSELNL